MLRSLLLFASCGVLSLAHAALLVTIDNRGSLTQQYFDGGAMAVVERGQPRFGVDAAGNCWILDRGRLVSDPCDAVFDALSGLQQQAMAGLGPRERAMMQQMLGGGGNARAAVESSGSRTIAGYPADCHRIGGEREICVSARLMAEIVAEMGDSGVIAAVQRFGQAAGDLMAASSEVEAVAQLLRQGYPMSDMHRSTGIPGVDPAMLQYLPAAQRAQLMQQFGGGSAGTRMEGSQVTAVERGVEMPDLGLERYPRQSFAQYLQQAMGEMGAAFPGMR